MIKIMIMNGKGDHDKEVKDEMRIMTKILKMLLKATNPMRIMTKKTAMSPSQKGSLSIRSSRETWFSSKL